MTIVKQDQKILLLLSTDQLFKMNTPHLKESAYPVLDKIVSFLRNYPQENIHISGNTDLIGKNFKFNNISLSLQQAQQIAGYFWALGIHKGPTQGELTYSGDDAKYPIATNKKPAGMAMNRRIQITIYPKQK